MRRLILPWVCAAAAVSAATAAPLVPQIISHDFSFGASEPASVPFYDPRGLDADHVTLLPDQNDREVTAFWEIWPVGGTPLPIFNALGQFGGDLEMYLQFDDEDAMPPHLEVSLTGSGRQEGADIRVWGAIPDLAIPFSLLIAIDVNAASLYGFGGESSFVLETLGTIVEVNPLLPGAGDLVGEPAASRGNIDFLALALPAGYHPLEFGELRADGGGYSGEVGRTPEPASVITLLLGALLSLRRRG